MAAISPETGIGYERDLRLIQDDDDVVAGEAFARLWRRVEGALAKSLMADGQTPDDADDHLQTVRIRLWERRTSLDVRSPGAWWALVRKVSRNLAIDRARANRETRHLALEEHTEIPGWDIPYLDAIVLASQDLNRIYEAADELWLGGTEADDLALLAVQFCVLDGLPPAEAAEVLKVRREQVTRWIEDPAVLRRVAYRELFWNNDQLAGFVLRPDSPFLPSQLDDLSRKARERMGSGLDDWNWHEVLVVLLRLRNGLLTEQILRFEGCAMDDRSLDRVLRRIRERFPFEAVAAGLQSRLEDDALAETGLWRRLAFQYHASSELPNRQVLERTAPAASVAGVKLTEAMLNNWIGLGRLWSQLAVHVQGREKP